jgi:DNA-directed RNA polymerase specialized sigma24 family protein
LYETQEGASMSGRSEEFREFARDRAAWPLQQSAYLLCGDWHSARDVVQETLIKAYRHWPPVKRADNPVAVRASDGAGVWARLFRRA